MTDFAGARGIKSSIVRSLGIIKLLLKANIRSGKEEVALRHLMKIIEDSFRTELALSTDQPNFSDVADVVVGVLRKQEDLPEDFLDRVMEQARQRDSADSASPAPAGLECSLG